MARLICSASFQLFLPINTNPVLDTQAAELEREAEHSLIPKILFIGNSRRLLLQVDRRPVMSRFQRDQAIPAHAAVCPDNVREWR